MQANSRQSNFVNVNFEIALISTRMDLWSRDFGDVVDDDVFFRQRDDVVEATELDDTPVHCCWCFKNRRSSGCDQSKTRTWERRFYLFGTTASIFTAGVCAYLLVYLRKADEKMDKIDATAQKVNHLVHCFSNPSECQ